MVYLIGERGYLSHEHVNSQKYLKFRTPSSLNGSQTPLRAKLLPFKIIPDHNYLYIGLLCKVYISLTLVDHETVIRDV